MELIETNHEAHLLKDDVEQHPLKSFGYGIEQWYQLLWELICLFVPITLIALGMMYINQSMGDLEGGSLPFVPKLSLGNFEGAFSSCISQPLGVENRQQTLSCPKGTISELKYVGVINGGDQDMKLKQEGPFESWKESYRFYGNNYCGDPKYIADADNCQYILNEATFRTRFSDTCIGKEECSFDMNQEITRTGQNPDCEKDTTIVYAQVNCQMTEDE